MNSPRKYGLSYELELLDRESFSKEIKSRIREFVTDLRTSGEIVYDILKSRWDIEQSYDTFKNTIHADRTYMRDDYQMLGWMFINFLALMMHYRIYGMLRKHDALGKYSPKDVIEHLERIQMLRIGEEWKISEIPKQSRTVIEKLELPIMYNSGI